MTPTRLGLLIFFVLFVLGWGTYRVIVEKTRPGGPATTLPEPISYAKPTPGGNFVMVVFGSLEAETKLSEGDMKRGAAEVRRKYPKPGMYSADGALVYPLEGYTLAAAQLTPLAALAGTPVYPLGSYTPDDNLYLTSDGRYVARIEGDSWQTRAYPAGTRLSQEVEQNQLDAPAVSLFSDGKLLKSYTLKELLTDPGAISHSPKHILWPGGAVLNERDGRFLVYTQDANRATFDIATGEMVSHEKMGFGNRFAQITIIGTLALTVLLAAAWAYWAFRKRRASDPPLLRRERG